MSQYEHPYFPNDDTEADRWVTYTGTLQPEGREPELQRTQAVLLHTP